LPDFNTEEERGELDRVARALGINPKVAIVDLTQL